MRAVEQPPGRLHGELAEIDEVVCLVSRHEPPGERCANGGEGWPERARGRMVHMASMLR
ncbi:hypothetical protein [Streptomyces sp. NPDC088925]|uniref:hypothetical protein n=1 Tax=Streptomyces sp. NPDC088925 TaxID=3365914 RepID=UPI0037FCC0A9